jgi:hypothetical protein
MRERGTLTRRAGFQPPKARLRDVAGVLLRMDDREAANQTVPVDHYRIDTVISRTLGGPPPSNSPRFEQLPYDMLELRRSDLGEIRSESRLVTSTAS